MRAVFQLGQMQMKMVVEYARSTALLVAAERPPPGIEIETRAALRRNRDSCFGSSYSQIPDPRVAWGPSGRSGLPRPACGSEKAETVVPGCDLVARPAMRAGRIVAGYAGMACR